MPANRNTNDEQQPLGDIPQPEKGIIYAIVVAVILWFVWLLYGY